MNNNATWRVALLALIGAACLFFGQLLSETISRDQSISITRILDAFYHVIVGITFDPFFGDSAKFGSEGSPASILINVGRLLLPATFIYALYRLVRIHLVNWWTHWRASHARNHVIVTGNEAGEAFSTALEKAKSTILLSGPSVDASLYSTINRNRITLIRSDNDQLLHQIAVQQAQKVILAGNQSQNLADYSQLLSILSETASGSLQDALTIHIAIESETIMRALLGSETALKPMPGVELRPFSLHTLAARRTFEENAFHLEARKLGQSSLHALFIGFGAFNEAMYDHFLQMAPAVGFAKPVATIATSGASQVHASMIDDIEALKDFASVFVKEWPADHRNLHGEILAELAAENPPVTTIFVDLGAAETNATMAVRLRQIADEADIWDAPIFAYTSEEQFITGPTGLSSKPWAERVAPVGQLSEICRLEALDGSREQNAQRIHEHYRDTSPAPEGRAADPGNMDWALLNETWRNSSRRAGDHVPIKHESARHLLKIRDALTSGNPIASLDDDELLELAKIEHDSWAIERILQGWRLGERDNKRKLRPSLVPFGNLPEEEKRKDFDQLEMLAQL